MSYWTQYFSQVVANGDSTATITWPVAFLTVPVDVQLVMIAPNGTAAVITAQPWSISTTGCTVKFSAAAAVAGYTLAGNATALQAAPTDEDCPCAPADACCGNTVCAPQKPQLVFFQGLQGGVGPIAVYRGAYVVTSSASTIFYCNANRVDVVAYAGFFWVTANPAKNATNTWGVPGGGDWVNIGTSFNALLGGSYGTAATAAAGQLTFTPTTGNEVDVITITGAASLRLFILSALGRTAGDRIVLSLVIPATAGLTFNVRNDTNVGTQLLPVEVFPANTFTSDGVTLSAAWEFVFNGTAWTYLRSNIPA